MRFDYFLAIKEYKKTALENGEWDSLDNESKRFVDKIIEGFESNGMGLPAE